MQQQHDGGPEGVQLREGREEHEERAEVASSPSSVGTEEVSSKHAAAMRDVRGEGDGAVQCDDDEDDEDVPLSKLGTKCSAPVTTDPRSKEGQPPKKRAKTAAVAKDEGGGGGGGEDGDEGIEAEEGDEGGEGGGELTSTEAQEAIALRKKRKRAKPSSKTSQDEDERRRLATAVQELPLWNECTVKLRKLRRVSVTAVPFTLKAYAEAISSGRVINSPFNRITCWSRGNTHQYLTALIKGVSNLDMMGFASSEDDDSACGRVELEILDGGNRSDAIRRFYANEVAIQVPLEGRTVDVYYQHPDSSKHSLSKMVRDELDLSPVTVKRLSNCTRERASEVATALNRCVSHYSGELVIHMLLSSRPLQLQLQQIKPRLDALSRDEVCGARMQAYKYVIGSVAAYASGRAINYEKGALCDALDSAEGVLGDAQFDALVRLLDFLAAFAKEERERATPRAGYATAKSSSARAGGAFAVLLNAALEDPSVAPADRSAFDHAMAVYMRASGSSALPATIRTRADMIFAGKEQEFIDSVQKRSEKSSALKRKRLDARLGAPAAMQTVIDEVDDRDDDDDDDGDDPEEEVEGNLFTDSVTAADGTGGGLQEDDLDKEACE